MQLPVGQWKAALSKLAERLQPRSRRSRSILLYLFFVFISALLWCFMTFNSPMTMDMKVPMKITGKPDNVNFISEIPDTLTITVQDRGMSFFKFFLDLPTVELDFNTYARDDNTFKVDAATLRKKVAGYFGRKAVVTAVSPEQLISKYTSNSAKVVPVELDLEGLKAKDGYVVYGPYTIKPEKVKIYGDETTLASINKVYADRVIVSDLTDTLRQRIRISNLKDARVVPSYVELIVPVERLVDREIEIPIEVCNLPDGVTLRLFPSAVKVSYRAPNSIADRSNTGISVVVDYNELDRSKTKIPIRFGTEPLAYGDLKIEIDSADYIIENSADK